MLKRLPLRYKLNFFYWKKHNIAQLHKKSKLIETRKGPVEYSLSGNGEEVIAAVHGAPGNFHQCDYIFYGLSKSKYKFLSWSRPGYLRTPLLNNGSVDDQSELLAALLDALNIKKIIISAFSCGAPFGINFAIKYPERSNAIILDSPVAHRMKITADDIFMSITDSVFLTDFGQWFIGLFYSSNLNFPLKMLISHLSTLSKKEINKTTNQLIQDKYKADLIYSSILQATQPFSLNRKGYRNDINVFKNLNELPFSKIKIPTLIIHGTKDSDVPIEHGKYLLARIPDSKLLTIENATHLTLLTDESKVLNKKKTFLKNITVNL
ncbi:MAG: alpha/beta hydrolase [bacterium]|nr:alpha/beta hydrolase [bacterium]